MSLIETIAKIKLFAGEGMRKTYFLSGYRPLFDFPGTKTKLSGSIRLIDIDAFEPGDSGRVRVFFIQGIIDDRYFLVGQKFTFSEGRDILGEGEITEMVGVRNDTI